MKTITSISQLKKNIFKHQRENRTIGFVPTMGALHEGHLSLIRKCRRENDVCVVSIFVNPTQFGPHEDFAKYPRQEKKDKLLAQKENVDIIFYPSDRTMYPSGFLTKVEVSGITRILCGRKRKGHFTGVTTVVCKLLNLVEPDTLYLGQKDYQQAVVIKKMIADLNINVTVKICPTVREKDGLALSSRNAYLTPRQRTQAPVICAALKATRKHIRQDGWRPQQAVRYIEQEIRSKTDGQIEYIECVDAQTLDTMTAFTRKGVIALAVKLGKTRLIDNIIVKRNENKQTQS
jgi:pantoate--beta-alanine ligase